jgi:PAS domain-containing protein
MRLIFQDIKAIGFERARIFQFLPKDKVFECVASFGPDFDNLFQGKRIYYAHNAYAAEIYDSHLLKPFAREFDPTDPQSFGPDPNAGDFDTPQDLPWAAVPLSLNGELCGQVAVDNKVSGRAISKRQLEYLTMIASLVSKALGASANKAFNRVFVDDLPAKVVHKNRHGQIVFANKAFVEFSRKTMNELALLTDSDLFPSDIAKKHDEEEQSIITGAVSKLEGDEEWTMGGTRRGFVHFVKGPLRDFSGQIIGVQTIFWDKADADMEKIRRDSCFISHSTKDQEFARRLHSRMQEANMRVWFALEDLKGGKKLHEQLFQAIQIHDRLLLVLSEHSIQSEWVITEIRKALEDEKQENRRKLFPIRLCDMASLQKWTCLDVDRGKDLAAEVREYFIPDFSNWQDHDAFETAFARLKKDLEAGDLRR